MSASQQPARRLRVAVFNRVFAAAGGGAESYSIRIVEQLAARHEVHVFAQRIDHEWPGVSYHRIACLFEKPRWINQLWFAFATWRATRSGFDVIHSHENTWHGRIQTVHVKPVRYNLLAGRRGLALAGRWLKIALSPRLAVNLWLEAARMRPAAGRHVVLASEMLRAQTLAVYPGAAPLTSVITPGVALPAQALAQDEARRLLGLPPSAQLLLFVANDYARKGLDALLSAMTRLPQQVALLVAGNPAGIPAYRQRARSLGLEERVSFLGAMKDLAPIYRAATVLVHPTLDDTFAMVVLEAMAHGLPAVVSGPRFCGIAPLLQDGVDALLLDDPRDVAQLAACIQRLLDEPGLHAQLAMQGQRFARSHDWASAAAAYERLYLESIGY